ncbi:MAG: DUF2795 domain-containing protein [Patescibacteria group bacterium]|nr:DUF2795 domain-containing protein [Patescibacteria group bacterium]
MKKFKKIAEEEMSAFEQFVQNLEYPISKEDLMTQAEKGELEEYIVELLSQLDNGVYNDPDMLSEAIGVLNE